MSDKKKSFLGGAAILAVAGLICKVIGAVYKIPLRNIIGAKAMGIYITVYPIYTFLLVFSTSGIPTAISKLVAEERSKGNGANAHKVFLTSLKLLLLIGGITTLLMFIGSPLIAKVLKIHSSTPIMAIAFSLLFVSLLSAYRGYYQGMQNMVPTAVTQLIEQLIKLIAGFYFAFLWSKSGPSMAAAGALFGITLSELAAFLTIFFMYQKNKKNILSVADKTSKNHKITKRLLAIAIPITIGGAIKPLVDAIDSVMARSTLEGLNIYNLDQIDKLWAFLKSDCGTLINMPSVLTVALAMALVPAISEALTLKDSNKEVNKISTTGIKFSVIIGLPCTIGLFALAEEILSLLYKYDTTAQLNTAGSFMMILSVGVLLLSIIQTSAAILQGVGKVSIPVINLAIGMAIKILMNIFLIPIPALNIYAVPIGTVTCYAITAILDIIAVRKYAKTKISLIEISRPIGAGILMAASIYGLKMVLNTSSSRLVTVGIIGVAAVVYFVGLAIFSVFDETDIEFMPGGRKLSKLLRKLGVKIRPTQE